MKVNKRTSASTAASPFQISVSWLPAFLIGLSLGILIHFLPGMREVLEEVRQPATEAKAVESGAHKPPMRWQPPATAQRRPGSSSRCY